MTTATNAGGYQAAPQSSGSDQCDRQEMDFMNIPDGIDDERLPFN